ncbi:MAG: hypothetical protein QOG64_2311, partial [Acidimicrobiaceae bacterium]|nr:hypothetical protein [Acidimicrobiaceae bacterium]
HTDDAAAAVVAAVRAPAGLYNVVDDEPLTRREHFAALAEAFGLKMPKMPGAGLAKLGGRRSDALARSQRVSNGRFRGVDGWAPQYPSAREGYRAIAAAWAREEESTSDPT